MASKIIKFTQKYEDEFLKYEQAVYKKEYLLACSYFNSLKKYNRPEIFVLQTVVYSSLKRPVLENQCLINLLKYENFTNYNIQYAVKSISRFFKMYEDVNVEKYYTKLTKKRMERSNQVILDKPRSANDYSYLRFVPNKTSADIILKCKSLIVKGEYKEAIELLNLVTESDKNYIQAQNMLVYIYTFLGKTEESKVIAEKIIQHDPENLDVLLSIAILSPKESELNKEVSEKLLKRCDDNLNFIVFKTENLIKENQYIEALNCLKSAKKSDAYSEHILFNMARCYFYLNDRKNAVECLKKMYIIDNSNYLIKQYLKIMEKDAKLPTGDLSVVLNGLVSRKLTSRLLELIDSPIEDFLKCDIDELNDCLMWALNQKNKSNLLMFCNKLTQFADGIKIIVDKLTEVSIGSNKIYYLLLGLVRNIYRGEVYVLLKHELKKIKFKYPSKLLNEFNVDEEGWLNDNNVKIDDFVIAYSETYCYLLHSDLGVDNIEKVGDRLFIKLGKLSSVQREAFLNINLLSAVLASMLYINDQSVLKIIAKDFNISSIAIIKALRLIEEV